MKIFIGYDISCRLNYQHDYIAYRLHEKFEIVDEPSTADAILFLGTCSTSERHIEMTISYMEAVLEQKKKDAKVYVTGCITRKFKDDPKLLQVEQWLKEHADFIIPATEPNRLLKLISEQEFQGLEKDDFGVVSFPIPHVANLYIGNGCMNRCTFCKLTFQEYPLKSAPFESVKSAIDSLDEDDISELYLKATNISQYGFDLYQKYRLPDVIQYLETKEYIQKVTYVGFSFWDAIKNDFAPFLRDSNKEICLSGSLESGSPRILKLIGKGFMPEEMIEFAKSIREKHPLNLVLNIIAGFPTETREDILKTLDVLEELEPEEVIINRYTNSSFVASNQYEQHSQETIQNHARIYEKALKKKKINSKINGGF